MLERLSFCLAAVAAVTTASGCNLLSSGCTGAGCVEGATITVKSSSRGWAPGHYTFDLKVDGAPASCTVSLPPSASGLLPGGIVTSSCSARTASLTFEQDSSCVTTSNGMAVSETCTPLAGQFHAALGLSGTPVQAAVDISRDGAALLSETVSFSYRLLQPNGANCGGCNRANATILIDAGVASSGNDGGSDAAGAPAGDAASATTSDSADTGNDAGSDAANDAGSDTGHLCGPPPPGCARIENARPCAPGFICDPSSGCTPSGCGCDPRVGLWGCTGDCSGGICVAADAAAPGVACPALPPRVGEPCAGPIACPYTPACGRELFVCGGMTPHWGVTQYTECGDGCPPFEPATGNACSSKGTCSYTAACGGSDVISCNGVAVVQVQPGACPDQ